MQTCNPETMLIWGLTKNKSFMLHVAELSGHTYDLSCPTKASLYPAGKSSHNKQGSTDTLLLEKAPKSRW